ncbi:MAG: PilT/PilU family type 4a pilus ATPase [Actinobacteria bacterium]|nr:PilT/PilU family type 4a pilus ATPase [Actinomycetota bacterium]
MDIEMILEGAVERGASDIHIRSGAPPYLRIAGDLHALGNVPNTPEQVEDLAFSLMDDEEKHRFLSTHECDFAFTFEGVGRFRVNVYRQRGLVGMAIRRVLPASQSFEALGLPPAVVQLAEHRRGLILVTGMSGAGKTTTTAALINHINMTRRCHIVTVEDPIEVVHEDKMAIVDQREVGIDTADFHTALRYAMRQDPDLIFIGEMRDLETVSAAMHAAETGHLVVSTLHTIDAMETVNRVIDLFPPFQQAQARISLAASLRGIISQRLLQRADGRGRVPAVEVLVMNGRIYDMIMNPDQTHLIPSVLEEGEYYGMQTFDQHLIRLYRDRVCTLEELAAVLAWSAKPGKRR